MHYPFSWWRGLALLPLIGRSFLEDYKVQLQGYIDFLLKIHNKILSEGIVYLQAPSFSGYKSDLELG